ncbi:MAG: Gfo/Idh/MocA family oxidoreductase [Bacteroidetes bacterium]|nr:Gfo/Idh/MocA family oxidoreductase [Bacteroidota bacterium]
MVRIGVFGVGHLGKIHVKLLKEIPGYEIVGFYDPDDDNSSKAEEEFGLTRFDSPKKLMASCDAIDIISPTITHYSIAQEAVKMSKHIFVEKPMTESLKDAKHLVKLVEEAGVKAMVGHVERFNPALLSVNKKLLQPVFIEVHRLAQFNPRGTDVSVVLDLMIHDIDIILSLVKANIKRISASGVAIVSKSPDIASARIEFDNGCVANVTASRISLKSMRKIRIFQPGAYVSMDFLAKKSEIIRIEDELPTDVVQPLEIELADHTKKYIVYEAPETEDNNAIKMELELFLKAIIENKPVPVSIQDGYNAMDVAHQILDKIEQQMSHRK